MFCKTKVNKAVISAIAAGLTAGGAGATFANGIEEVIVTATKTSASTQDIPVAVSAVTAEKLDQLGISNFEDYLIQLPGVTAGGSGPGQNTIYIRGVASTTPNLTTASVAGLSPNVAFYLDEQPLAQPGRNLDVYAADLSRVEVLAGPQGTLFGASSQAGTVRLITNKPDPSGTYGQVKVGTGSISDGGNDRNFELMFNAPLTDNVTMRAVVFSDTKGGYIDNVQGTRSTAESARFRVAGAVRDNGVPVNSNRGGKQAGAGYTDSDGDGFVELNSNVNFVDADNAALVEDDFNEAKYTGGRLSALIDINEDWSLLVAHTNQTLEADGVFFADPNLDDLEIQRFAEDTIEDEFDNTSWTLSGRAAGLDIVYTGAYTERTADQVVDYSDYLFVGQYLPYYICDYTVTYPAKVDGVRDPSLATGTCYEPALHAVSYTESEVTTHELRVTTDQSAAMRLTAGAFLSDLEVREAVDFTYPSSLKALGYPADGTLGFAPNYPLTDVYNTHPGPYPRDVIFRNDTKRTDEQMGIFGELSYDIDDDITVTVGARYYDIDVDIEGSANSSFYNFTGENGTDAQAFGTNISELYSGNTEGVPDKASASGTIFKVTASWTPTEDQLFYATVSEGFRSGLLNRPGGKQATNAAGDVFYTVPYELQTDDVMNYELGWKTDLMDGQMRLNGSVFMVDIENLQTTVFDPSITNLFFSDNAADAEVTGLEADMIWAPASAEGLTITAAISMLDSEITRVITPTNDVTLGSELAFAPEFQGNLQARYEWSMASGMVAHVMSHIAHSAESYSDVMGLNRDQVESWTMMGLTAGVSSDSWSAELYVDNLSDERAELARNYVFDRQRVSYARPRTLGMRLKYNF